MKKFKFDAERGWGHCKGTIEHISDEYGFYRISAKTQIGYISFLTDQKVEVGSKHIFAYDEFEPWAEIDDELEITMEGEE